MKRFGFLKTKIGRRFLVVFLTISLLPPVVMSWITIRKSESGIRTQTASVLRAASDGAEAQLREFLQHFKAELLHASHEDRIRSDLQSAALARGTPGFSNIVGSLSSWLEAQQEKIPDVREVCVLTLAGRVLASSAPERAGSDVSSAQYFLRGRQGYFAGDIFTDPNDGQSAWIMAAPIRDPANGRLLGVVAFRIDPQTLSELTSGRRILSEGADTQSFRIGDSGETYIVNRDHLMITESRYISNAVLRVRVDTLPVRVGLERGQEITAEYADYRGMKVSGASVLLRDLQWIVITEIDFRQAFAPMERLRRQVIGATLGLFSLAAFLAWSFTWRLLRPVYLLNESDRALAAREEANAFVPEIELPDDEIGELVRHRNARVKRVFDYQRQLEERTAKLQEMINELEHISYAIVHDMRAPLRAMKGFAQILENDPELTTDERKDYLHRISTAAVRLDQLIQDVLTYNRTVLHEAVLRPVDLGQLFREILETYPDLGPEKAQITIEEKLPLVIGNEALLTECFSNLLDNAAKFVAPGTRPQIRIWAERGSGEANPKRKPSLSPRFVRIWIEDNGIGIPPDARSRLFRMFQRLTNDGNGTGLGLAIVHKVVERMGGKVGVESQPDSGSRFWVELQRAQSDSSN